MKFSFFRKARLGKHWLYLNRKNLSNWPTSKHISFISILLVTQVCILVGEIFLWIVTSDAMLHLIRWKRKILIFQTFNKIYFSFLLTGKQHFISNWRKPKYYQYWSILSIILLATLKAQWQIWDILQGVSSLGV